MLKRLFFFTPNCCEAAAAIDAWAADEVFGGRRGAPPSAPPGQTNRFGLRVLR